MQDSQGNVHSGTQPVPKETPTQGVDPKLQETVSQNTSQSTVETPTAAPQSSQRPVQQVAQATSTPQATKKKSSGLKCNVTTCLLGSCVGCFVLVIVLVLLAIFAAPFLSEMLNKVINQGVEVPEITEVALDDVNESLASAIEEGGEQTIEMTEDEFNTLIKQRFEEEGSGLSDYDLRVGFEKDLAKVYMKLSDWMPWAVLSVTGSENGEIEMSSIKLGPIDIQNIAEQQVEDYSSSFSVDDISLLFAGSLFEEDVMYEIKGIYFENEKITIVVEIGEEIDLELPQEAE